MLDADEIAKLAHLRDTGILSKSEFEKKKRQFVNDVKDSSGTTVRQKGLFSKGKLLVAVAIAIAAITLGQRRDKSDNLPQPSPTKIAGEATLSAGTALDRERDAMPRDQGTLIAIIEAARTQYASGANDMARGAARPARARALCGALPSRNVTGWIGQVADLSTNGDGKGVISVSVGPSVKFHTWNNALSDVVDRSLIEPHTSLFDSMAALSVGQLIRFSGHLYQSSTDCFEESSLTLSGSIREPEFLFSFQTVSPIAGNRPPK